MRDGVSCCITLTCVSVSVLYVLQMKDGRRTSSLKASYEAIKNNDFQLSREFSLSREGSAYPSSALASTLTQTLTPSTTSDSRGRKSK